MSAPGIQLNSQPHLTYFQPSIPQYLQSIKEALMSNNLPAARQAFAQLKKAIPSPSQASGGRTNEVGAGIGQGLHAVGKALEAGDLSGAEQAVGELRQHFPAASDGQPHPQQGIAAESTANNAPDVSSEDGSSSDSGPNLNVRV